MESAHRAGMNAHPTIPVLPRLALARAFSFSFRVTSRSKRTQSRGACLMLSALIVSKPSGGLLFQPGLSRLLANQSQHVLTPLEARPPDRVAPASSALQTKCGIVRDQRAHGFDAAAAKHRTVGSVEG